MTLQNAERLDKRKNEAASRGILSRPEQDERRLRKAAGPESPDPSPKRDVWSNATLVARQNLTASLAVFRVRPDGAVFPFRAGQYTVIGLPASSPRVAASDPDDVPAAKADKLILRAYSIASSSRVGYYVELYITLVRSGALTPRLWMLGAGDRLWLGPKAKGHFTLDGVPSDKHVVLIGTGTGLAPYMSMIREHHRCNLGRRFVVIHGARYPSELGYRDELEKLDRECTTLSYIPTVSRPGESWTGRVGRVQTIFGDGLLEAALGAPLSAGSTHVFVAGNPEMVEDVQRIALERGFGLHDHRTPGTLHIERYW